MSLFNVGMSACTYLIKLFRINIKRIKMCLKINARFEFAAIKLLATLKKERFDS